jgi:hypothetical protein
MAHQTRFYRREVYRPVSPRTAWAKVRRGQVRRALRALEALYRR